MNIVRKGDVQDSKWRNVLLHGFPGSSKTTTAALYGGSHGKKHLHILTEGHHVATVLAACEDADVVPVSTYKELQEAYAFLRNDQLAKDPIYGSVALDSIDDMQDALMRERHSDKGAETLRISSRDDYSAVKNGTVSLLRAFRDLPLTTLFLAKSVETQDEGGRRLIRPKATGGGMDVTIVGMMHLAGYCYLESDTDGGTRYMMLFRAADDTILVKPCGAVLATHQQTDIALAIERSMVDVKIKAATTVAEAKAAKEAAKKKEKSE